MNSYPNRTLAMSFVPAFATPASTCARTGVMPTAATGVRTMVRPCVQMPITVAAREKSVLLMVGAQHRSLLSSEQNPFGIGTPVGVGVRRDVATGVHARGRPVCP